MLYYTINQITHSCFINHETLFRGFFLPLFSAVEQGLWNLETSFWLQITFDWRTARWKMQCRSYSRVKTWSSSRYARTKTTLVHKDTCACLCSGVQLEVLSGMLLQKINQHHPDNLNRAMLKESKGCNAVPLSVSIAVPCSKYVSTRDLQ